jgi:hypothetical protein
MAERAVAIEQAHRTHEVRHRGRIRYSPQSCTVGDTARPVLDACIKIYRCLPFTITMATSTQAHAYKPACQKTSSRETMHMNRLVCPYRAPFQIFLHRPLPM